MAERYEVYKCELCGNIVTVLHGGKGELVCCGQPMVLKGENTTDAVVEKHVPVIEKAGAEVKVKVGSVAHPMTDEHYIEWIQVRVGDEGCRRFLKPGDAPEAEFEAGGEGLTARAYCNIHGLWKGEG
ncbi:MAG: desulfoferrodoxin [Actinobacteria bacterium]|nr:desulfoferrodoxin [Actinomycetota bacterium]